MYQRINGSDWRNIWLMGDLHGCFALLMNRLRQLRFDPWADLLISVGDLIDRGPQSADCLGLLRCRWFRTVRGNHEQMALEALGERRYAALADERWRLVRQGRCVAAGRRRSAAGALSGGYR
ncbi:serine/threonine protein phosphatase 1 [Klebsiella pneumoniae]|uniref:Serine/threonine protein phosphatase 1 n=1 Tax=Klebsiella pneumoniae TaxID=573 RepID=A0A377WMQ9_KLEPN|nr:serine/threonine protein phosphatase 1 [Klebsiella pneumoniae]